MAELPAAFYLGVFTRAEQRVLVRTDGGSFGADNMRSMIDTESPEPL
jgi:hypothetical protein